jgi:hypothetical protein
METNKKKLYIFCFTHALPTALAMTEDGDVIAQHGGNDADDAIYWLFYHRPHLREEYEVVEVDQKLVERHIYKGEPLEILPEGLVAAFRKNQEKGSKAKKEKV